MSNILDKARDSLERAAHDASKVAHEAARAGVMTPRTARQKKRLITPPRSPIRPPLARGTTTRSGPTGMLQVRIAPTGSTSSHARHLHRGVHRGP